MVDLVKGDSHVKEQGRGLEVLCFGFGCELTEEVNCV